MSLSRKTSIRRLLGVVAWAAVLATYERSPAGPTIEEDCRSFCEQCEDARALGHRDAGICHVEERVCKAEPADEPDAGSRREPRGVSDDPQDGPIPLTR